MFTKEEIEILLCGIERIARESEEMELKAKETKEESERILKIINRICDKLNGIEEI